MMTGDLRPSEIGEAMRRLVLDPPLERLLATTPSPEFPLVMVLGQALDERFGIPEVTIDRMGKEEVSAIYHKDLFDSVKLDPLLPRAIYALIRHQQQTP